MSRGFQQLHAEERVALAALKSARQAA